MQEPSLLFGGEISDSNSSSRQVPIKHRMHSGRSSSSKYKGVVSQCNGHWGAQIYANHQRFWLGTFKSELEAAMAYDSAASKLRSGHSHRNFPWTDVTLREPDFQDQFSTEVVLSMIKDGSYAAKFTDYLMAQGHQGYRLAASHGIPGIKLRQLFQKELTPSDVGKLNRFVIPKKYAVKYFPPISDVKEQNIVTVDDIELVFFDRSMRPWKFCYSYWKSSQSFVFTRGWNRFAKEKGLRPMDWIIFSSYESSDQKLCIIDVAYRDGATMGGHSHEAALPIKRGQPSCHHNGNKIRRMDFEQNGNGAERENDAYGEVEENVPTFKINAETKGLKLFGVQIV